MHSHAHLRTDLARQVLLAALALSLGACKTTSPAVPAAGDPQAEGVPADADAATPTVQGAAADAMEPAGTPQAGAVDPRQRQHAAGIMREHMASMRALMASPDLGDEAVRRQRLQAMMSAMEATLGLMEGRRPGAAAPAAADAPKELELLRANLAEMRSWMGSSAGPNGTGIAPSGVPTPNAPQLDEQLERIESLLRALESGVTAEPIP